MKNIEDKEGLLKKWFGTVSDNVKEGASFVGEKVAETSAKAYIASSELVSETSEKIHDYTEKQELHKEEKKLLERQQLLTFSFGEHTLAHYLKNDSLHKTYLNTTAVAAIVEEYKANVTRIEKINEEIQVIENH